LDGLRNTPAFLVFTLSITNLVPIIQQKIIYQSLSVFLNPNLGCPFILRFRYLLERYFVMSSIPDTSVACLSMRVLLLLLLARSKILAASLSVCPTISQKMLAGWHIACIWVPFFVHRKVPRSESIDFSHEGSFSTIHLDILLSLCTVLSSVINQIYWLCLKIDTCHPILRIR
jgi:hypothetical protein